MADGEDVQDLEGLLNSLDEAGKGGRKVSLGDIYEAIGERSFGPLLLGG